jgi:hypothetical protein
MAGSRPLRCLLLAALLTPPFAIAADAMQVRSDAVHADATPEQAAVQAWLARQDDATAPEALGTVRVRYAVAVDPVHGPDWKTLSPVPADGAPGDTVRIDACASGTLRHWSFRHDDAAWRRIGYGMKRGGCTTDSLRSLDG